MTSLEFAIYAFLFLTFTFLVFQLINHKKMVKSLKSSNVELEELLKNSKNKILSLSREFESTKNGYIKKITEDFSYGLDIIQFTTNNMDASENIFLDNISSINGISNTTAEVKSSTAKSKYLVEQLKNQVNFSTEQLQKVNDDHSRILKKLKDVQEKCSKINEIAFQAHLLSFNAAIEAKQAGEYGKGFSVVAQDIGEMANLSKKASDEITITVNESLELMTRIAKYVDKNIQDTLDSSRNVISETYTVDSLVHEMISTVLNVEKHATSATEQMVKMKSETKTKLENLNKILSDIIGTITGTHITEVHPKDIAENIKDFYVVDVRNDLEWNDDLGHLSSAVQICLQDNFKERLSSLDRDGTYLFVCRSGGRSARAARIALTIGFKNVYNLEGGMLNWKEHGLKTVWDKTVA